MLSQFNDQFLKWKFAQLDNKNMKIINRTTFRFSKSYDLITIGPYANRVAKAAVAYENSIRALTVEQENHIMEPSLISLGSPRVYLQQKNSTFSDIEMGVGVEQINPDKCFVILKNGAKYFYKNLVYSGNPSDWKSHSSVKEPNFREKNFFIHNDVDYENIDELFARRGGSIVFTVPKDMHFGCQNYFMLLLKNQIKKNRAAAPFKTDPLKITVLCEGSSLVTFNQAYNRLLEDYLQDYKIKVIKNTDYSINAKKRQVKIYKGKQTINFDSLFEYLPLKVPKVLSNTGINPFQTNRHILSHSKYQNIFILGNVVNNVYSLSAVSQMSRIIAQNVVYRTLGVQKRSLYQGYSMINIWLNNHECHQIETDYNGARLSRDLGQFKLARKLAAQYHTSYLRKVTETTINSGFNIFSMFSQAETISTERHQVPTFYRAQSTLS